MAFDWVRRWFGASRQREIVELGRLGTTRQASDSEDLARRRAAQWLEASKSGDLNPPSDVHDAHGWDEYRQSNLRVGAVHQAFADMMSSDPELLPLLTHRGARSILCVGNGLSMEAASLGVAGFEVTALDVSAVAAAAVAGLLRQPDHPLQRIPGFHVREDDGLVEFGRASETPAVWPGLHHSPDHPRRDGGTLSFVTGDLSDSALLSGTIRRRD